MKFRQTLYPSGKRWTALGCRADTIQRLSAAFVLPGGSERPKGLTGFTLKAMDARQGILLNHLIEEYVETTEPVGSKLLAKKYEMAVSPATIRNDMVILEEEGYLRQPHISAGRVPTERAYRYWIEHSEVKPVERHERTMYERLWADVDEVVRFKSLARALSDEAENAVVIALGEDDFYYTGLSALFAQPEFEEQGYTVSLAKVIDHLDQILGELVKEREGPQTLLGSDNPFGNACGFVGTTYVRKPRQRGCIGILGPLRMHYPRNIARMRFIAELING
ncbi:MAG: hypothetical protein AB1352_01555 [Patescibacteria group bacterium]